MTGERNDHWERVYATKDEAEVSWYQDTPSVSLKMIERAGVNRDAAIVDIGGGASNLVDALLDRGFTDLTVLDLSEMALHVSGKRLGAAAEQVQWIAADITRWQPERHYTFWHDRATFHFLTDPRDRAAYLAALKAAVPNGGWAMLATFALDGPEKCSGLPVVRYSPDTLAVCLGSEFTLVNQRHHLHATPGGASQSFQFSLFRREPVTHAQ
ncbi:class I SAM-dependent methyltransferase [uncultured Jannaschia sp.]|uniref:class I SAM-dependent methyltransferase n=1 Tax=uncultured Jannaschia sp. TaxID=293347 RepID=UPI0026299A60|nr:class I SAM-dependent methyltransferase [uncultured Jannaschia sp.]